METAGYPKLLKRKNLKTVAKIKQHSPLVQLIIDGKPHGEPWQIDLVKDIPGVSPAAGLMYRKLQMEEIQTRLMNKYIFAVNEAKTCSIQYTYCPDPDGD